MEEQKVTSFFRFEDLRVYDKSLEYYNWLTIQAKQADDFAKRALFMPLMDAAAKISINIAEGTSYHKSQFVNFLKDAKTAV
ncbi:MAG: four helix bundle protein, partial [Bacteroidales bacterium]|nr:four helix bundle protein [Bacteroidales bacterium]